MRGEEGTDEKSRKPIFLFSFLFRSFAWKEEKIHGIFTIIYGSFGNADINGPLLFERAHRKDRAFLLVLYALWTFQHSISFCFIQYLCGNDRFIAVTKMKRHFFYNSFSVVFSLLEWYCCFSCNCRIYSNFL